jgi:hypothetical protein
MAQRVSQTPIESLGFAGAALFCNSTDGSVLEGG